nr:hypothetical protein [Tanacetum cinerariifolium]
MPNPTSLTSFIPPSRTDRDMLFQLLFDELLTPPPSVNHPAPEVIGLITKVVAPKPAALTGSPSSTTVDQDAPSPSYSQTTPDTQSPIIPNDVEDDNHDLDVTHMNNEPFFGLLIPEDKEGKAVDPSHYHGMIGTLLYLTASRPDLQIVTCMCARYQAQPIEKYLHAIKRIFRYLRGTVNQGLWYPKDSLITLIAFADADHAGCQDTRHSTSDADHAGCQDTRHSTSGSMQFLGDRLVSWSSSKHIDIKYHFIKEHVENRVIKLYFINTEYQLADIFTKALGRERIEFLINKLGMQSFTPETLKYLTDEVDE